MANPLIEIDRLVAEALTEFGGLTSLVPTHMIQSFDRAVDVRGDFENMDDLRGRIWIVPGRCEIDLNAASGSVGHIRSYSIGFGCGGLNLAKCRDIERQIQRAVARLNDLKTANGVTPITQPSPIIIDDIQVKGTDPEREPIEDPSEWRDVCDIIVIGRESRQAILV